MRRMTLANWLYSLMASVVLFVLLGGGCQSLPQQKALESIDLQGHRGARGLRPENTIPAFRQALKYGMTTLELDTTLTKEGRLIVHHDTTTNPGLCRKDNGNPISSRPIRSMTVAELKKLDCGAMRHDDYAQQRAVPGTRLITLKEFFDFVKKWRTKHANQPVPRFNIELKFPADAPTKDKKLAASVIVQRIEKEGVVERAVVQSFAKEVLPMVKRRNPKVTTSALFSTTNFRGAMMLLGFGMDRNRIIDKTQEVGAGIVSPHYSYVSPSFVHYAHQKGIAVIPWTVNDTDRMAKLLRMGVDGIISDYPNRLRRVYNAWNQIRKQQKQVRSNTF